MFKHNKNLLFTLGLHFNNMKFFTEGLYPSLGLWQGVLAQLVERRGQPE